MVNWPSGAIGVSRWQTPTSALATTGCSRASIGVKSMPAASLPLPAKLRSAWRHRGLCHRASPVNARVSAPSPAVGAGVTGGATVVAAAVVDVAMADAVVALVDVVAPLVDVITATRSTRSPQRR